MECHEGTTMIKTFRGSLADNGIDTIVLHTNDGSTGYKIVKFQIMGEEPGNSIQESIVQIFKVAQTTASGVIDFSDNTLLGVAILQMHDSSAYQFTTDVIFDREIFNQDIYVTHKDVDGTRPCNYYLELEQVKLDLSENTVATLKDIRNAARIPTT